jgi:hypothetical protein
MFAIAIMLIPAPAHAYLDPGAGSILLQSLLAAIAAVTAVFSVNFRRLKSLLRRRPKERNERSQKDT